MKKGVIMSKRLYCHNCGSKVMDSDFCPKCGTRVRNYAEETQIKKSKKTRNILLIVLAIVVIACILIFAGAYVPKNKEFKTYNFSNTCSVELPSWINFNDGAGDINSNSNIAGSNVQSTTKSLFGNSEVMQITYSKSVVDGQNVGVNLNDAINVNVNGKQVYTRIVMSEETGESISVMGENATLVNYIAEHAKFNGKAGVNKTNNTTSQTNDNQKHAFAYKSDGTPMYSQAEVDAYMKSKYGNVNYHIQSNGYISMDEPNVKGYDRDGAHFYPSSTPSPEPSPTPTPTPTNRTAKMVNG